MEKLKVQNKQQEVCRMSWFLMEMDEGQAKGGKANGKSVYGIIHCVELLDKECTNMYIDRRVRFNWKHAIMDGYIVMAADDRLFVEEKLQQIAKENEKAVVQHKTAKRYLVQYTKGTHTVVHAVVHQKEVLWPYALDENSDIREVLIVDGKYQRIASVLHISESDELMQQELDLLKDKCFQKCFIEPEDNKSVYATPWLLVQHSTGPSNVNYSVINVKDTVWQTENVYRNVVAYFNDGDNILQSVIIRKSMDRTQLNEQLNVIKTFSKSAQYPLSGITCIKVPPPKVDKQGLMANYVPV